MSNGNSDYPGAYPPPMPYPGYGYPPPQAYYPPPAPMMAPYGMPPGQDMNSQLLAVMIPLLTTMPALKQSKVNTAAIINAVASLPTLPQTNNSAPTQAEFNALVNHANALKTNLLAAVNNDQTVFSALAQGLLMQIMIGAMTNPYGMGGSNVMVMLVLVMALGGTFGI